MVGRITGSGQRLDQNALVMERGIAKTMLQQLGPTQEAVQPKLPGEAHSAMDLYA